ncbi:hypothetical protein Kpho02_71320 [Kitasatospora phosalacinea]|uniref:Uncharacterized protein n=1 Tax=Kitasatospora phosalacinea TaxID=2065 RepID=A0A9W6QCW8_9ACTN|nr:hypothetical protein [Kitasatospora phosalacinea]GLW74835.1 hypothetical protein Kpho02_71320 [Kitasatospora phosalacinea]
MTPLHRRAAAAAAALAVAAVLTAASARAYSSPADRTVTTGPRAHTTATDPEPAGRPAHGAATVAAATVAAVAVG